MSAWVWLMLATWLTAAVQGWSQESSNIWRIQNSGTNEALWGIAYRAPFSTLVTARLVVVGERGTILTSDDDGATWVRRESGTTETLRSVAMVVPGFIAVGDGGVILASIDGDTWQREISPVTTRLTAVGADGGPTIAVGDADTGFLMRGEQGGWTRYETGGGEGSLLGLSGSTTLGRNGLVLRAPNSLDLGRVPWTPINAPTGADLHAIAGGSGPFERGGGATIAVGAGGTLLRSDGPDGWTQIASGTTQRLRSVIYKWGGFVPLVSNGLLHSFGEFFVFGSGGVILRSVDGVEWVTNTSPTADDLHAAVATAGHVFAVGARGTILQGRESAPKIVRAAATYDPVEGTLLEGETSSRGARAHLWVQLNVGAPRPVGRQFPRMTVKPGQTPFPLEAAVFRLYAANGFGLTTSDVIVTNRFLNLSARGLVTGGEAALMGGFAILGETQARTLLVRAAGPSLASFGVANPLRAPRLTLYAGMAVIATNTRWGLAANSAEVRTAAQRVGAFPLMEAESALLVTLPPGLYRAVVESDDGTEGISLLEIYDTSPASALSFVRNLSTRAEVRRGESSLAGGLVIDGGWPRKVLIRAVGPGLAAFGVGRPLARPSMVLWRSQDVVTIAERWGARPEATQIRSAAQQVQAFALAEDSLDAAMLVELGPGAHTVTIDGADNGTGVVLLEVYSLP